MLIYLIYNFSDIFFNIDVEVVHLLLLFHAINGITRFPY